MGNMPVAQPSPPRRFRVSRTLIALVAAGLVVGGVLALAVAFAWPTGSNVDGVLALAVAFAWPTGSNVDGVLALAVAFAWPTGSNVDQSRWVAVGRESDFQVGQPAHFPEHRFWLVRLDEEEFVALWQRSPFLGCTVAWRPDFEFMGRKGWFRDPCHSGTFDLLGRCFAPQCPRGMDRFPVRTQDGEVQVNLRQVVKGPPVTFGSEPVNPPREAQGGSR